MCDSDALKIWPLLNRSPFCSLSLSLRVKYSFVSRLSVDTCTSLTWGFFPCLYHPHGPLLKKTLICNTCCCKQENKPHVVNQTWSIESRCCIQESAASKAKGQSWCSAPMKQVSGWSKGWGTWGPFITPGATLKYEHRCPFTVLDLKQMKSHQWIC